MNVVVTDPWMKLESWVRRRCADSAPERRLFDSSNLAAMRRLRDALASKGREGSPGPMDLAVLVRHVLWSMRTGAAPTTTWMPAGVGWPEEAHWRTAGLLVATEDEGYRVVLERWAPTWLALSDEFEPGAAAAHADRRQAHVDRLEADPFFVRALGLETYSSPGQREAVRALALAPEGGTVIANLPTGTGKSAVAYSVAAQSAQTSPTVALVVVPTTALALDQDRAFRSAAQRSGGIPCPDVLAYYGSLPRQAKTDLRQRIRTGQQTIVFTSPESLLGGLRTAVFEAASRGLISLFAVDEAHVAVAWGEEFRPEFQFMAPLRDELLERQRANNAGRGFPTVLMSGTLTAAAIDRLVRDFGRNSKVEVVSAAALRPEPEYWIAAASDAAEREGRVLEALAHLPRPAILYTTRPLHADEWRERLLRRGYGRIAVVHGGTDEIQRQAAMTGVRGIGFVEGEARSTIDLVIGTSAYGLGVDQPDIRSIVHACLPESIDRFYQEVGRGGRDGCSSVSVLIPASDDWQTARSLASDAIITIEKARERWKSMRAGSEAVVGGGRRVRLGSVPAYLFRESDTNEAWNLRTLLLLQQAGVLRIRVEKPPRRLATESDAEWDERAEVEWRQQRTTRILDLLVGGFENEEFWHQVEMARTAAASRGLSGFHAMVNALRDHEDLSDSFASEYSVRAGKISSLHDVEIHVARACGGCPGCRRVHRRPYAGFVPVPPPASVVDEVTAPIIDYFHRGATDVVLVLVDDPRESRTARRLRRAISGLVAGGLRSLVAAPDQVEALRGVLASRPVLVATEWEPTALPDLTTVVVALESEGVILLNDVLRRGPRRLIFVDADAPDPDWPHQKLASRSHVVTLAQLLQEL